MTKPIDVDTDHRLENLLDEHGLTVLLDALTAICRAKAAHLRENWQDNRTARDWDATALKIERHVDAIVKYCPLP